MAQGVDEQLWFLELWSGEERRRSQGGRYPRQLVLQAEGDWVRCFREEDAEGGGVRAWHGRYLFLQRTGQA